MSDDYEEKPSKEVAELLSRKITLLASERWIKDTLPRQGVVRTRAGLTGGVVTVRSWENPAAQT